MLAQVLRLLACHAGGVYVDCTVGEGGHALGMLERVGPRGRVVGIDRDRAALEVAAARLRSAGTDGPRVDLVHGNYADLGAILGHLGIAAVDGVLFDLGASSLQFNDAARGFAYNLDGPLDMRYDRTAGPSAADLVNSLDAAGLASIIGRYGEERWAARIARFIVEARRRSRIERTAQLAEAVKAAIPAAARRRGPHPARRTFQALRIAANGELASLEAALPAAVSVTAPGACICVISFHSLEDRIVKRFFRGLEGECRCPPGLPVCGCGARAVARVLTAHPIVPDESEVEANPRARSALLRAVERRG
jgi:16S rRNA (cytosine1402-N4)-methyltransferase